VLAAAVHTLSGGLDRDWQRPAAGLEWTCWETVEHVSDDLFAYAGQLAPKWPRLTRDVPFGYQARRPGGPANIIFGDPEAGPAGLVEVLDACGGLLAAMVRGCAPGVRAHHVFGVSDPEGFAAMGVVEMLLHLHDVAGVLDLDWKPADELCDRVLYRLFPDAPPGHPGWLTLLWATGRAELPGHSRLTRWRWQGEPRATAQ
jgi:hypothetical protein